LERLSSCAHKYLNDGGFIALETGNGQPEKVVKFFKSEIWQQPATDKDMSGIERFVFVSKKQQRGYNG
jgi:methylase of polypeptide subunit release factors